MAMAMEQGRRRRPLDRLGAYGPALMEQRIAKLTAQLAAATAVIDAQRAAIDRLTGAKKRESTGG